MDKLITIKITEKDLIKLFKDNPKLKYKDKGVSCLTFEDV